ncbi:pentapeptide repeat-containing protein [Neosynechococcus sphagnicola]|uniref:pentapeptide repeat-containing protein n=1 Tax=Neosynechococcus sphagnicola TaxID=1501145 RepID=UPI00068ADDE2|nr:pentapeptide repeat-containing protein [Neosynechococcus sphagnicola]
MNTNDLLKRYGAGEKNFRGAQLSNVNLMGAKLAGINLSDAELSLVNFNHAILRGANLCRANLNGIDLIGTNLSSANLSRSLLIGADLSTANLGAADLSYATLSGATLVGTCLRGANLQGAMLNNARLVGADLRDADLSSANLQDADLSGANLLGATLNHVTLEGAVMPDGSLYDPNELDEPEIPPMAVAASRESPAVPLLNPPRSEDSSTAADGVELQLPPTDLAPTAADTPAIAPYGNHTGEGDEIHHQTEAIQPAIETAGAETASPAVNPSRSGYSLHEMLNRFSVTKEEHCQVQIQTVEHTQIVGEILVESTSLDTQLLSLLNEAPNFILVNNAMVIASGGSVSHHAFLCLNKQLIIHMTLQPDGALP